MLEIERVKHLDLIEEAAKKVGMVTRRDTVKDQTVIMIKEASGSWCQFDPILNGKDLSKFLWHGARRVGLCDNEQEFRKQMILEMMTHDYTVPEKRKLGRDVADLGRRLRD